MSIWKGLSAMWNDPTIRKKGIKTTVIATVTTGALTYGATRIFTKESRRKEREYLNEPDVITVNGELYEQMSDGTLVPYWRNHPTE